MLRNMHSPIIKRVGCPANILMGNQKINIDVPISTIVKLVFATDTIAEAVTLLDPFNKCMPSKLEPLEAANTILRKSIGLDPDEDAVGEDLVEEVDCRYDAIIRMHQNNIKNKSDFEYEITACLDDLRKLKEELFG